MTTESDSHDQTISDHGRTEPAAPAAEDALGDPAPGRPRGRVLAGLLAGLALLLALAALGGAGYLYYELIETADVRDSLHQVQALKDDIARVDQRFDEQNERDRNALAQLRQQEEAARKAFEQSLRQTLANVARQAPPSTGEWQRAEAQYLLRIANHRLLLEHDVTGALQLLRAADSVLADLDDFALHEVRARIADETASLEAVKGTDVQGLFLRLEAVKRQLGELPLRLPEYLERAPVEQPEQATGWWPELRRELSGMVRIRHFEGAVKPLLGPDEAVYLQLNLRLMLERAQLAAVRREQMIYEESIATAIDWIHQYLDAGKPAVKHMIEELSSLRDLTLDQPLPDISGSLDALKEVLRHPS